MQEVQVPVLVARSEQTPILVHFGMRVSHSPGCGGPWRAGPQGRLPDALSGRFFATVLTGFFAIRFAVALGFAGIVTRLLRLAVIDGSQIPDDKGVEVAKRDMRCQPASPPAQDGKQPRGHDRQCRQGEHSLDRTGPEANPDPFTHE